jgi:hypothetical protein
MQGFGTGDGEGNQLLPVGTGAKRFETAGLGCTQRDGFLHRSSLIKVAVTACLVTWCGGDSLSS